MVLSQFRTLTVFMVTSSTMPSTPYLSSTIQSPGRSMSWAESCTPATTPRIVSRNTSISTVAMAPSPVSRAVKSLFISEPMISITPMHTTMTFSIW